MRRRHFCKSTLAAGVAATLPSSSVFAALNSMTQVVSNIAAVTAGGESISLEKAAVQELKDSLSGSLVLPKDAAYESARHIWNGMIDKRPALIVLCANIDDVVSAVTFASERNLLLSVKGGGHSFPGKSTCDDGLMLDLSGMHTVEVDVENETATSGGGALLGHLDSAALKHNLITTTGVVAHTGVGGFTLGGGLGRVDRMYGLAVDNLLAAEIVTAKGEVLRASETENADLFWAIRGGGGNFGVATEFVYRLHPFNPIIYGGHINYPIEQAEDCWKFFAEFSDTVPDECNLEPSMNTMPDGQRFYSIEVCVAGDHKAAEKMLAPLLAFGKPMETSIGPMPYATMQTAIDGILSHGKQYYLKSGYIEQYTDDAITAIVENYEGDFVPGTFTQHLGGYTATVDPQATAFWHRKVHGNFGIIGVWEDKAETEQRIASLKRYYAAVEPYMKGFYTNLHEDSGSKTRGNYGVNYERLVAAKNQYDPTNFFRLNSNIKPTV
jgi:FAD/FMN-containing dehydrogenase